ncbi:hypothetical protein [Rubritalea sp.]|uniref:hypothetical protein n=1 Tax=Rubritalea sp. TaxID=2109375 RepID=UPI003EF88D93
MSYSVQLDLDCHRQGDPYLGLGGFAPVTIVPAGETEAVTPPDPLTRVSIKFKRRNKIYSLDTDASTNPDHLIYVTDADLWSVEVGRIADFLPVDGAWAWSAKFYSDYFGGGMTLCHGVLTVIRKI